MAEEKEQGVRNSTAKQESLTAHEIKELTHDLRELRDRKTVLQNESRNLKGQLETLKARLSGADKVIASLRLDIQTSRVRIDAAPDSLQELEEKKDGLIEEINRCQSGIKTATKNIKNFLSMRGHLEGELMDIINEKAIVIKKLRDTVKEVQLIEEQKAQKLPYLKECDIVLRQLSRAFREVENRMDVSIKFSSKKIQL